VGEQIAIFDRRAKEAKHIKVNLPEIEHLTVHHLPVLVDKQYINAFENLEYPAHGRHLGILSNLVGDTLPGFRQAQALFPCGEVRRRV
jgi:hypothetical protein